MGLEDNNKAHFIGLLRKLADELESSDDHREVTVAEYLFSASEMPFRRIGEPPTESVYLGSSVVIHIGPCHSVNNRALAERLLK